MSLVWTPTWTLSWLWLCACPWRRSVPARLLSTQLPRRARGPAVRRPPPSGRLLQVGLTPLLKAEGSMQSMVGVRVTGLQQPLARGLPQVNRCSCY